MTESVRKYRCLYDKSCADCKNKVFVENAWAAVDKEMYFQEGKEFSYFLCRMKFKQRTPKTKPSSMFITIILKLENAMRTSGVPYHLFINKRVIRI